MEPAPAKPSSPASAIPPSGPTVAPPPAALVARGTDAGPEKPPPKETPRPGTPVPEVEQHRSEPPWVQSRPAGKPKTPAKPQGARGPLPEGASPLERLLIVGRSEDPRLLCLF